MGKKGVAWLKVEGNGIRGNRVSSWRQRPGSGITARRFGAIRVCVKRARCAVGGVGGALRGSPAGFGGPLPDSSKRIAPPVPGDHHGSGRFPGVPPRPPGRDPPDPSSGCVIGQPSGAGRFRRPNLAGRRPPRSTPRDFLREARLSRTSRLASHNVPHKPTSQSASEALD